MQAMGGTIIRPRRPKALAVRLAGATLLSCLACLIGALPAWATPAWLPATELSASGIRANNPAVAMDSAGDTVAVWEGHHDISHNVQVSTRSPGASFSAPLDLSEASTEPRVAMTPGGEAVIAWVHFENPNSVIEVSTAQPGGGFSPPTVVSSAEPNSNPQGLQLAVNPAGEIAVAWVQKEPSSSVDPDQFSVLASVGAPASGFSAPAIISPTPLIVENEARDVRLAIDPGGDVTAVWDYFEAAAERDVVQGASLPAGGSFSAPLNLSEAGQSAFEPAVAIDSAGEAIAVWTRSNGTNFIIQASSGQPGGSFSAPIGLSEAGADASMPEIAMAPGGAATVAWIRPDSEDFWIAQASAGSPGESFSAPVNLSASGEDAEDPEVAINASGAATVVWQRFDGSNKIAQASTSAQGAGFGPAVDLSRSGQNAVFPSVAMDGGGDATAVWSGANESNEIEIVEAAGYDADAPVLRGVSVPSSGTVGTPVSFSANPFDVWPIASTTFNFGDGAKAEGSAVTHTYSTPGTYQVTVTSTDAAGTPVAAQGTIAIAPSSEFTIGGLALNKKKGTGTLTVIVPGPGKLVLSGKAVQKASKRPRSPGKVKLAVKVRGKDSKILRKRGKVRVSLAIAFTPNGGSTRVKHAQVTLIIRPRR